VQGNDQACASCGGDLRSALRRAGCLRCPTPTRARTAGAGYLELRGIQTFRAGLLSGENSTALFVLKNRLLTRFVSRARCAAARFPRIGNGNGRFFQALEKLTADFSKAWKKRLIRFPMLGKQSYFAGALAVFWSLLSDFCPLTSVL